MIYSYEESKALRETHPFDPRNVADEFKGMSNVDILAKLEPRRTELVICCSNEIRDLNFGGVVRSANNFAARKVIFVGRKAYDRRGAVGSHHLIDVEYIPNYQDAFDLFRNQDYTIVAAEFDLSRPQTDLVYYKWHPKTMLVLGEEGRGLESNILDEVDDIVYIPMFGSVRSLNVASAATVMMYDYMRKITYERP